MANSSKMVIDTFAERKYKIAELSRNWNMSREKVRLIIKDEDGVVCVSATSPTPGKRRRFTYLIPESVARRVWTQLTTQRRSGTSA